MSSRIRKVELVFHAPCRGWSGGNREWTLNMVCVVFTYFGSALKWVLSVTSFTRYGRSVDQQWVWSTKETVEDPKPKRAPVYNEENGWQLLFIGFCFPIEVKWLLWVVPQSAYDVPLVDLSCVVPLKTNGPPMIGFPMPLFHQL